MKNKLLGVLVGLARVTDGNEHFITPELTALITDVLKALQSGAENDVLENLYLDALAIKKAMVPNCFLCDNPCGRTSDFNISELDAAPLEVRDQKYRMLILLQEAVVSGKVLSPTLIYDALYLYGMEMDTAEYLMKTINSLEQSLG